MNKIFTAIYHRVIPLFRSKELVANRFCPFPFSRAHISVSGDVFVCCSAWIGKTSIGNVFYNDFQDIWNSNMAQAIRESILDGSFKFCKQEICPRIVSGKNKKIPAPQYDKIIKNAQLVLEHGPEQLSLNYDYTCNLQCKSCRNEKRVLDTEHQKELIRFQNAFLRSPFFKHVKRLTITGAGETLSSKVYMDLFKKIQKVDNPQLKITLRTNGLLLTPQNWERIRNVHYAIDMISISIDAATEKTYQTIRQGGNFKKLLQNLEFVKELKKQHGIRIKFNFVVQKSNYREMPEFVTLAKRFASDIVAFSKILNLGTYSSEEYHEIAIHHPDHPDFTNLKRIINQPIFKDTIVHLRNLSHLLE